MLSNNTSFHYLRHRRHVCCSRAIKSTLLVTCIEDGNYPSKLLIDRSVLTIPGPPRPVSAPDWKLSCRGISRTVSSFFAASRVHLPFFADLSFYDKDAYFLSKSIPFLSRFSSFHTTGCCALEMEWGDLLHAPLSLDWRAHRYCPRSPNIRVELALAANVVFSGMAVP